MRTILLLAICASVAGCNKMEESFNAVANEADTVDVLNASENEVGEEPQTPDPNEIVYCKRVLQEVSRANCDAYERAWQELEEGSGSLVAPDRLVRGETGKVRLAISANPDGQATSGGDEAAPEPTANEILGEAPTQTMSVKVGARMAAKLAGEGFAIDPKDVVEQELSVTRGALWEWQVTPLKGSRHRLMLQVFVRVKDPSGEKSRLLRSTDVPIQVRVTPAQTIGDYLDSSLDWFTRGTNWLKALAAFIAAIGGVVFAVRNLKASKPSAEK